jgi:hypothetical protein
MELSVLMEAFKYAATVAPLEVSQANGESRKETIVVVYRSLSIKEWEMIEQMDAKPNALNRIAKRLIIALPELTEDGHALRRNEALRSLDPRITRQIVQWILLRNDYKANPFERAGRITNLIFSQVAAPTFYRRMPERKLHINEVVSQYGCDYVDLNDTERVRKLINNVRAHYAELIKRWK